MTSASSTTSSRFVWMRVLVGKSLWSHKTWEGRAPKRVMLLLDSEAVSLTMLVFALSNKRVYMLLCTIIPRRFSLCDTKQVYLLHMEDNFHSNDNSKMMMFWHKMAIESHRQKMLFLWHWRMLSRGCILLCCTAACATPTHLATLIQTLRSRDATYTSLLCPLFSPGSRLHFDANNMHKLSIYRNAPFMFANLTLTWCRVLQQNQDYIPNVLAVFLGSSGMGHPDEVIILVISIIIVIIITVACMHAF